MRFKKIFLLICLVICLFTIASACAGDVNDMAMASEDTGQGDLFQSEKMADDILQTVEEQANDDEIVGAQNNPDDYYIAGQLNKGSYTDLQFMIDNCTEDTLYLDYNITFDPDYDLAPDNPYNESINFTEGIQIKKTLTIEGNGYAINGLNQARIFDVVGNNIVINNITFVNGKSKIGGAILFNDDVSNIVIDNCKFMSNSATNNGGAVYVNGKFNKSAIQNTVFISNSATKNGGAVYILNSSRKSLFENLTFVNNRAVKNDGGAINFHWELIETRFINITFFKNSANNYGGAINTDQDANYDNAYVDVRFINNTASNGGAMGGYGKSTRNSFGGCSFVNNSASSDGGAISYKGDMAYNVFENCSFTKNTAGNGSALYVRGKFTSNVIGNTEFIGNAATGNGGAVYIRSSSSGNLFENLTFSNNRARSNDGGAINFHGETSQTTFSNVTFFKNSAGISGGAVNTDNNVNNDNKYVNVDFINNTAYNGGAMGGYGKSTGNSFDECLFANNSVTNDGGAIYYKGNMDSNIFENCSFINNAARTSYGGAISTYRSFISNKFNKCSFVNNIANLNGGALYVNGTFKDNVIGNSEFISNVAKRNGGAVYTNAESSKNQFENLTFSNNQAINNDGGAINFHMETSQTTFSNVTFFKNSAKIGGGAVNTDHNVNDDNEYVNVDFINNNASKGGALNGYGQSNGNSFDGCSFVNNSASNDGGAIYYKGNVNSTVFESCSFINNSAGNNGGVMFGYRNSISNKFNKVLFINNSVANGAGVIYYQGSSTSDILEDSIFINNNAAAVKVNSGSIKLINNWFGNNATNYNETPNVGIKLDNWLFLNATARPDELTVNQNSVITFKLYSYNVTSGAVNEYNASEMNVELNLIQTLGELNQQTALFGEKITYTAKQLGNAEVTGKFETASYTISLNVNPKKPTAINVTNSTLDLEVNDEVASGASLTPAGAGNLTYTSSNPSVVVVENDKIKALANGTAIITVSFAGNDQYGPAENKTITVTVSLNDASVNVYDDIIDLFVGIEYVIDAYTTPEGLDITFKSNNESVATVDANGKVTAVGEGNTTITVSVGGDGVYALNSTTVTVNVGKITTEILIANETLELKVLENVSSGATLIPDGSFNLTYVSSNETVAVVQDGIIKALKEGTAIITVSFAGNDQYDPAENKTITVTVLYDASVSVNNSTVDLMFGDNFTVVATANPIDLPVNFSSSNSSVVTVDADGKISAVGIGNAVITVSVGGDGVYALNSTTVNVNVGKKNLNISAITFSMSGNVTIIVTGFENATGNVTVTVGENIYNSSIMWGMAFVSIPPFDKDITAYIYYPGDDNYYNASTTDDLIVKKNLNITVSVNPIHVGENATVIVTGLENATGNVSVIAGRSFFNAPIVNGTATAIISGLNSTTTAYILFMGDDYYNMTFTNVTITVLPARENVTISADPVTATYNINKNLVITLKDASGKALSGVNVTVDLNGAKIYVTDKNGQVKVNVAKLVPNTYTAVITFNGDDVYANSTKNVQVTVKKAKAKIKAKKKTFKSNKKVKKYRIALKDQKGKAIKKVKVTLKIKGKKLIKAKTNNKGKATFKIKNLKKTGKHKAKIKFKGNKYYKKATKKVKIRVK